MSCHGTLTLRVERRRVAIAYFVELRLDYFQVRDLPAEYGQARQAAERFAAWAVEALRPERIVIEEPLPTEGPHRRRLRESIRERLAGSGVPLISVPSDWSTDFGRTRDILAFAHTLWPETVRSGKGSGEITACLGLSHQMLNWMNGDH